MGETMGNKRYDFPALITHPSSLITPSGASAAAPERLDREGPAGPRSQPRVPAVLSRLRGRDRPRRLQRPVKGTPEIVSFSIVIILWLQAAYAIRSGGMIWVDAVHVHLPNRAQRACEVFAALLGIAFFGLVCWGSVEPALYAWNSNEFEGEGALRVPVWPARFMVFVGSFLAAFNYLLIAIERSRALVSGGGAAARRPRSRKGSRSFLRHTFPTGTALMFGTGELLALLAIMLLMVFAGVHVAVALGAGAVAGIYMMHGDINVVRDFHRQHRVRSAARLRVRGDPAVHADGRFPRQVRRGARPVRADQPPGPAAAGAARDRDRARERGVRVRDRGLDRRRRGVLAHRLPGDEALRLRAQVRARLHRGQRLPRHADPALGADDRVGRADRAGDRQDLHRRHPSRLRAGGVLLRLHPGRGVAAAGSGWASAEDGGRRRRRNRR